MKRGLLFFLFLWLLVGACNHTPFSSITGDMVTVPRGATRLQVISQLGDLQVTWQATGGIFDSNQGDSVIWLAPHTPGTYQVEASITEGFITETVSCSIKVVQEPALTILTKELIRNDKTMAFIAFKNEDQHKREIKDFLFYMFLWDGEGCQGNRILYQGQDRYRGGPNQRDLLPIPWGVVYDEDEWELRFAKETRSILPWVYYIEFTDGEVWNLYEQE